MTVNSAIKKLDAWSINKYAIELYKKYFPQIILIGCVSSIVSFLVDEQAKSLSLRPTLYPSILFTNYIVLPIISVLLYTILVWFLDQREQGIKSSIFVSFKQVFPRLIYVLLAQLIVTFFVSVGLVLLIIPGIIWWLMFSQVEMYVILKKQRVRKALTSSKQLTKGNLWLIARSYLLLYFPLIIIFLLFNHMYISKFMPGITPVFTFIWDTLISQLWVLITYSIWRNLIKDPHSTN